MVTPSYPKRLIEVDLPIKKISEHARHEKSIRHGHISTIHLWWARKPLTSSRAVICAALWPDPEDPLCPERFRTEAEDLMRKFWNPMGLADRDFSDPILLRQALLDFIVGFSDWANSTDERYISTARKLTLVAHESTGGTSGSRPLLVDPFAGGGSIPLEALRIGADCYASDLNPVAVLLNKVVLEYIPKYGKNLGNEVQKWGQWVAEKAEKELSPFYPKDPDGSTPIAYLWARTIRCEGPGCGAEIPLISSLYLAKKRNRIIALKLLINKEEKSVKVEIVKYNRESDVGEGTVKRGSCICPICGFTTPITSVRNQMIFQHGGAEHSRLLCVVITKSDQQGRYYRLPIDQDYIAIKKASEALDQLEKVSTGEINLIPDETTPSRTGHRAVASVQLYGIQSYENLFSRRQLLALLTISKLIKQLGKELQNIKENNEITALLTCLALALDKQADLGNSLTRWKSDAECPVNLFGRQAIPMTWVFTESSIISESSGSWRSMYERTSYAINQCVFDQPWTGQAELENAVESPFPDESVDLFVTDPPYYDAVPYADLADFFYVWLKRTISEYHPHLFQAELTPKNEQTIVWHPNNLEEKRDFENKMTKTMTEGRRILKHNGIGTVIFAHKSTSGWEAMLQAMVDSGWIITGSWPIDTEMGTRMNARGTAALASSIHLVCRPRENPDGSLRDEIGDWRDILAELPGRIHDWMPRLAKEGVVGADAIFACLGPALEIFSRYSRVEKASGEEVPLREYLEHVWAAVSREALGMIFEGADATGFEEDARITAMWLWTLKTAESPVLNGKNDFTGQEEEGEDEEDGSEKRKVKGFALEYDAARKIAQGLGAHLEEMHTLVEIKKGNARLLPVSERAAYLLKSEKENPIRRLKKKEKQSTLFPLEMEGGETPEEDFGDVAEIGKTTLDKVHQTMLLFAAGQSDALKRFLVDEGIGKNAQFWTLAQALAALYPTGTEEKRWVEGVLARKKGLEL